MKYSAIPVKGKTMKPTVRIPNFKKRGGLVPIVVQDIWTRQVLMLVYTRKEEFLETVETGEAVFYSTSRKKRWKKGEEKSGNILVVHKILIDCDGDALVYLVSQKKEGEGACHAGKPTCFYRSVIGSVLEADSHTTLEIVSVHESLG